jgi:hypothetical protein
MQADIREVLTRISVVLGALWVVFRGDVVYITPDGFETVRS